MHQIFQIPGVTAPSVVAQGCQNPGQDARRGPRRYSHPPSVLFGAQMPDLVLPEDWLERTKPLFPAPDGPQTVSRRVDSPFRALFDGFRGEMERLRDFPRVMAHLDRHQMDHRLVPDWAMEPLEADLVRREERDHG